MGQSAIFHRHDPATPSYLCDDIRNPELTDAMKRSRAPFLRDFATDRVSPEDDGPAAAAVKRAREMSRLSKFAEVAVIDQAVFALSEKGHSVREIATILDMKKSSVGRSLRRISTTPVVVPLFSSSRDDAGRCREMIRDAWYPPYEQDPDLPQAMNVMNCLWSVAGYDQRDEISRREMVMALRGLLIERGEYDRYHDRLRLSPSRTLQMPAVELAPAGECRGMVLEKERHESVFGTCDESRREDQLRRAIDQVTSWRKQVTDDDELLGELDFALDVLRWGLDHPHPTIY